MPDDQNPGGAAGQNQGGQQQGGGQQGGGQGQPPVGGQQQQQQQNGGQPPALSWDQLKGMIPTEYSKDKLWDSVKDIPTLLKNYAEAQKYNIGAVRIPGKDAKPEEIDAYRRKLGRPETSDGYKLELPELPGGLSWSDDMLAGFKKWAYDAGLSTQQAQTLLNGYHGAVGTNVQSRTAQTKATFAKLEQEIGPGYEKELAYGQAAIKQLGGQEVVDAINQSGIGNSVPFIKMMIAIGRQLGEDSIIDVTSIRQTEAEAQTRIDQIMRDKSGPYFNVSDPAHERTVQEVNRLFGMLHPGQVG